MLKVNPFEQEFNGKIRALIGRFKETIFSLWSRASAEIWMAAMT